MRQISAVKIADLMVSNITFVFIDQGIFRPVSQRKQGSDQRTRITSLDMEKERPREPIGLLRLLLHNTKKSKKNPEAISILQTGELSSRRNFVWPTLQD